MTIIGVIMYLREGWVIGNAGILGGALIIGLSFLITICTGLSISSIATNIRIGTGGAYAIVSQSLGLEVGGSLGIPRYLSQALAITLYIFGFREGWLWLFPDHPAFLVDMVVFLLLWGIAYKSADLAIKTQYLIMGVIALSLVSIAIAAARGSMIHPIEQVGLWGSFAGSPENGFAGTDFWTVFAVFFPAATGIMAGANMSGDLKDPRRSIPIGTMSAIAVSMVVYALVAYWLARSATPEELVSNYYVMVEKAYWGWAIVAGIFGATFSSALASMVGSGRILQAMGSHGILPWSPWLGRLTRKAEPRNAMLVTGAIVFCSLLMRDLNVIAPLITMFFLITYAMLNMVVLIEQGLGLISFRPLLRLPAIVPWTGLIGSVYVMFIINPIVSLVSILVVLGFYAFLTRRHLDAPFEDVRSGLFVSFAEWAAKKASLLSNQNERAWKPNLLIPTEDPERLRGAFLLLQDIAYSKGSVKLLGIPTLMDADSLGARLAGVAEDFRQRGVFASSTVVDGTTFESGVSNGIQVLNAAFFRPNIVFLQAPRAPEREQSYRDVLAAATQSHLGMLLYMPHPEARLGQRQTVNVWIRDRSPDWNLRSELGNMDLSILTAYKLRLNWKAHLRLITVIRDDSQEEAARAFMRELMDLARLPHTEVVVAKGPFSEYLPNAPQADLSIFGLPEEPDFEFGRMVVRETRSSCLFALDSGRESALA